MGAPGSYFSYGAVSESYVVFGSPTGFPASVDVSTLDGTNGFRLFGDYNYSGTSVAGAVDINGDGFDDLIIGAPYSYGLGLSYVVFGSSATFPASRLLKKSRVRP